MLSFLFYHFNMITLYMVRWKKSSWKTVKMKKQIIIIGIMAVLVTISITGCFEEKKEKKIFRLIPAKKEKV